MNQLEIINVPLSEIKPFPKNAKLHPKEQIEQIKRSIQEYQFNDPIAIDESNTVIEGHGRLLAVKELGYTEVPCIRLSHLSEAQKRAYILAHNKLTMNTGFDADLLIGELDFLKGEGFNTELTGFSVDELEKMFKTDKGVTDDNFDEEKAVSAPSFILPGDLIRLGRHRLLCGDSTKAEDVMRLMDGKKANLCVTDPPYNCNVDKTAGKIMNDNMPSEKFYEFLLAAFRNIYDNLADGGAFYCFHSDAEKVNFYKATVAAGFHYSTTCVWVKDSLVLGRFDFHQRHEPVIYAFKNTKAHAWYGDRKQTSVWEFPRPKKSPLHSTMKPLDLIAYPIKNSSLENSIVVDLFGGSGTTIICCEQLNRIGYSCELDPKYASVITKRFVDLKGSAEDVIVERDGNILTLKEILPL